MTRPPQNTLSYACHSLPGVCAYLAAARKEHGVQAPPAGRWGAGALGRWDLPGTGGPLG